MAVIKDIGLTSSFIAQNEAFRSTPYWDVNGWAIGYGNHYNLDGSPVQPGQVISQPDAQVLMQTQIQSTYGAGIANRIGEPAWDNLTPGQQAAYIDASYNYGPASTCLSDSIAAAQSGDSDAINNSFLGLDGNGRANRAQAEYQMASTGTAKGAAASGQSAQTSKNANGNAAGSGAGCAGGGLGILSAIAGAGLFGGLGLGLNSIIGGLTSALGATGITGAMSSAFQAATGALGGGLAQALGQITGPINQLTSGAFQALSQVGSSILPSLTGVLPSSITSIAGGALGGALNGAVGSFLGPLNGILQNPLNLPNAIQQFASHGGLGGAIDRVANNMVGSAVAGGTASFMQQIGITNAYSGIANNVIGATAEAAGLAFGANKPGGLGANFLNNNGVVSFGMSALTSNLPAAANNLTNLGTFATTNLLRLQQPSNIVNQIVSAGLGTSTGITKQLVQNNIPVAGIDNPLNDAKAQQILNSITDPSAIGAVSSTFNVGVPLDNLGQLTNLSHMCPDLAATGPSKSFSDLGQHFISLGITKAQTFQDVGAAISQTDAGFDLNHLSQMSTPMYPAAADKLNQTWGYGGGSIGELTMADYIGTPAGYVHNDTLPAIIAANNDLMNTTQGQAVNALVVQLQTLLTGGYHVPGNAGGGGQPASADSIVVNGVTYMTLDDAVLALVAQIETALQAVQGISDPNIQTAIQACEQAHAASCAQILKENHNINNFGINLFSEFSNNPVSAYVFADGLPYFGQQNNYGQIGEYLERVAADNVYGDAIKGAMRMGRNAAALEPLGVNVERFRLPHSQYYRDPAGFYLAAYTGNLPVVPSNLADAYIPQTPQDIYVDARNTALMNAGYNPSQMLPAQADETYYDLQWNSTSPQVRENIGLNLLKQAVDSNIIVVGNQAYIIGLNRSQIPFAVINEKGLVLNNNDTFVATLMSIMNKMLYGNIGTTKYDNPFNTDQMVYGTLEMLSQITPSNIDALGATLLGSIGISGLLAKFSAVFKQLLQAGDTSMDRNIIAPWGGSGPDGQTTTFKK